jgi:hypothetical protein
MKREREAQRVQTEFLTKAGREEQARPPPSWGQPMIKPKCVTRYVAIISMVMLNFGCSVRVHQVPANAALMKQIGLPVYPHAQALTGREFTTSMRMGGADQLEVTMLTRDDATRVLDFYAQRVPKNATKTVIPLGFLKATVFRWELQDTQKEIMIERIKDTTIIQLQSMTVRVPTSSESGSPSAQP